MPSIRFTGSCRNKYDTYEEIYGNPSPSVNSPEECHQKCKEEIDCVAFLVQKSSNDHCYHYAKGPYTHGDGDSRFICYVMPGTVYYFHKYEN